ncbi:MAG: hypothetical protein RR434_05725 [Raoultibacter sp.]
MRQLFLLLKIQLLGFFGINKVLHSKGAAEKRKMVLFAVGSLAVFGFVVAYSCMTAAVFVQVGLVDQLPIVVVFAGSLAGVVVTFLKANGMMFNFKDYDMVMSLPVSVSVVVVSRIAALYVVNLLFGCIIMVPSFVAFAAATGAGVSTWVAMAYVVVAAPLLPMALTLVVAAIVAAIASRFRYANLVTIVLSVAVVLGIFALGLAMPEGSVSGNKLENLANLGGMLSGSIGGIYPPALWAAQGIVVGDGGAFVLFLSASLLSLTLFVLVFARFFPRINSALAAGSVHTAYSFETPAGKRASARGGHPGGALFKKELRRLTSTPVYLLNSCIGVVLLVIAALATCFFDINKLLEAALVGIPPEVLPPIHALIPWICALFIGLSSTTAASVSLEGGSRWLMCSAPVAPRVVLGAKLAVNVCITCGATLVAGALLTFATKASFEQAIALFVVPASMGMFVAALGLAVDARFPKYDWTSEYQAAKQSVAVLVTIFCGMAIAVAGMFATVVFSAQATGIALGISAALLGAAFLLYAGVAKVALYE